VETIEENKQLACRWLELIDQEEIEEICAITSPTWTMNDGALGLPPGPDGVRALFQKIGPIDQKWVVNDILAEGDKVVVRATNHCLQESFFGIPGSGCPQTFSAIFIHHIVDGQILATWRNADDLLRIIQLGARITPGDLGMAE